MLKQIRSLFRVLKSRDDFERGMSGGTPIPRRSIHRRSDPRRRPTSRGGTARPNRVRQPEQHSGRMPRSPRASTVRRIAEATPPRGKDIAEDAAIHSYRTPYASGLSRRESHDLRRRGLHSASSSALSGARPAGHGVQHISESRRPPRWVLNDELLRTPRQIPAFSDLAIYSEGAAIVGETGATERVPFMRVSPEFFSTLGANPAMGRSFTDAEMATPPSRVVILSDSYWRRAIQCRPARIGQAGPGWRSCEHRRGRSPARLPLFIVGSAAVFSLCVASRRSRVPGAAFGWEFETHHRSPQTRRHAGTGAGSD